MTSPDRPVSVPAAARWIEADEEWELGAISPSGKKHGPYRYWRSDGTLCNECVLYDGVPHGAFKRFHQNGEVSQQGEFVEGKLHGVHTWFACDEPTSERMHENGVSTDVRRTEMTRVLGRVVGVRHFDAQGNRVNPDGSVYPIPPAGLPGDIEWRPDLERWTQPSLDADGNRHGTWRFWLASGVLVEETHYLHGKKHGLAKRWHENGKLNQEGPFVDDEMQGLWRLWDDEGRLRDTSQFMAGLPHGVRERFDELGGLTERAVFDEGVLSGPYSSFDPGGNRYRVSGIASHTGRYLAGLPVGQWSVCDAQGVALRSLNFEACTEEGLAQSPTLASSAPAGGWLALASALTQSGNSVELLLAWARVAAATGRVGELMNQLEAHTIPLSSDVQDELAADMGQRDSTLTAMGTGLLAGARPSFVFRALAVFLDQKLRSRAALDFINVALLLDPDRTSYLFTRALVLMSLGLDAQAARAGEALSVAEPDQGTFITTYNRVLFPTFDFWPAKQKPQTYYEDLPDGPEQELPAIVTTLQKYATRVQRVRDELLTQVNPGQRWLPPDLAFLLPEGPVELERVVLRSEVDQDANEGSGEGEDIEVDESLEVSGHELPALMRQVRDDWEAMCWLCWAIGLDEVALPTRIAPREDFGQAVGMASQRLWRCRDKVHVGGLGARRSKVPGFSWEGVDIDELPTQLAQMAQSQYAELQAMFKWLCSRGVTSPWQDGLRGS